ncbi:hypothetical protein OMDBNIEC_00067 [Salmonella phage STP-SP5]|nr:hypothetical protein OMDBNIEC_00067 [Salmonella phage STP-SP5]
MTCIAWDGKVLAADRGVQRGDCVTTYKKVYHVNGHRGRFLIGLCGYTAFTDRVRKYFSSPVETEFPVYTEYSKNSDLVETCGLAIDEKGNCHFIYCDGQLSEPTGDPWGAEGSGCVFLAGALAAGATAEQAIQLAIQHTTCAFLGVDTISFEEF